MVRLYVLSTNFGQGEFGFTFCPIAKSNPDPEYSTVFSDPIAFVALSITVFASCANAVPYSSIPAANTAMHFLFMFVSPFTSYGNANTTRDSLFAPRAPPAAATTPTYCLPFFPRYVIGIAVTL